MREKHRDVLHGARADHLSWVHSLKAWAGISALVILFSLLTGLGVMYFHKRGYVPPNSTVRTSLPSPDRGQTSNKPGALSSSEKGATSPARTIQGKDEETLHLIPGGTVTPPPNFDSAGGRSVKVDSFYLGDTEITNQQFVHFLNDNLAKIKLKDGLVRGENGHAWLPLGEVMAGYEPIISRNGRFSVPDGEGGLQGRMHGQCRRLKEREYRNCSLTPLEKGGIQLPPLIRRLSQRHWDARW
jgi:hypothetical protein